MSLITDALKTAQRERSERLGGPELPARALEGFFPNPSGSKPARSRTRGAIAGATVLALVAVGVVVLRVWPGETPAAAAPRPVASQSAPVFPQGHSPPPQNAAASAGPAVSAPAENPLSVTRRSTVAAPTATARERSETPAVVALISAPDSIVAVAEARPVEPPPATAPQPRVRLEGAESRAAEPLVAQAFAAQRRNDFLGAKALYEQAFVAGTQRADAYNNYGALMQALGDLGAAIQAYQRAVRVDRAFVPAWVNLGVALEARGDRREATAALQQALQLDPANPTAKLNLALQYVSTGVTAEARRLLTEVTRAAPEFAEAHYALGQVLESERDIAGAVRSYNLFLQHSAGRMPQHEEQVRRHVARLAGGSGGSR